MKRFLAAMLVAWSILGAVALGPAGVSAAVRHIAVSHAPAPPLTTMEIGPGVTPNACVSNPQKNAATCPQPQVVQINLVQVPL